MENRQKFAAKLKPNSIAVLNSNDIMPTSADGIRSFIQNTDIFYLSGTDQEESILVIFPDAGEKKHKEIVFVKETDEKITVWEGPKYSKEDAKAIYEWTPKGTLIVVLEGKSHEEKRLEAYQKAGEDK